MEEKEIKVEEKKVEESTNEGNHKNLNSKEELKKMVLKELNDDVDEVVIKKRTAKQSCQSGSKCVLLDNQNRT